MILVIILSSSFFYSCGQNYERGDKEMLEIANNIYENYIFEYRVDAALFAPLKVKELNDGIKSYQWIISGSELDPIGIEVFVSKNKSSDTEWVLHGDKDQWLPLINTK